MKNQKGIAALFLILAIVAILGGAFIFFGNFGKSQESQDPDLAQAYQEYGDFLESNQQESEGHDSDALISEAVAGASSDADSSTNIPSTLPEEFVYKSAYLVSYEQLANRGISLAFATADSKEKIFSVLKGQIQSGGWQLSEETEDAVIFKKLEQSAQIKLVKDSDFNILVIALTFGR